MRQYRSAIRRSSQKYVLTGALVISCYFSCVNSWGQYGNHLYNQARDKVAQQIKDQFAQVDLTSIVKTQDVNLAAMAKAELALLDQQNLGQRNSAIFALIHGTNTVSNIFIVANARLRSLLDSTDTNALTAMHKLEGGLEPALEDLAMRVAEFRQETHLDPPAFSYTGDPLPVKPPDALARRLPSGVGVSEFEEQYKNYRIDWI